MTNLETDIAKFERFKEFVELQMDRYAAYHQSKEAMSYAGITLFGGISGTAIFSSNWPPYWGKYSLLLAILAVSLLWGIFLSFIRFQLTRRRFAALRVAGCERLLAAWIQEIPSNEDLNLCSSTKREAPSIASKIANIFWGSKNAIRVINTGEAVYPRALVNFWLFQEMRGTDALKHERLILITGWLIYIILIVSTWLKYCYFV